MATVTAAARAHYERVQAAQTVARTAARRAWRRINPDHIIGSWREQTSVVAPVTLSAMATAAQSGARYGVADMAARGTYVEPTSFVRPAAFAQSAPSGMPLEWTLAAPATRTVAWIGKGIEPTRALAMGGTLLDGMMRTFVNDAGRQAASADVAARPGVGYVRLLNPHMTGSPPCGACTILAGRWYRWNQGFMRHPRCRCIHRPVQSLDAALSEGLVDDPYEYFHSLSTEGQDRVFGKHKAEAIRGGADIYRVQNSWRGRDGLYTSEGTARRGFASDMRGRRLTPDGIYRTASTKAEALQLLEAHGYITGAQVGGGNILGRYYEGFGQMGRGGTRVGATAAVRQARETGVRVPGSPATATAAERRVIDAQARYQTALDGRNPFGRGTATPAVKAKAELDYRYWLDRSGHIYTS